MIGDFHSDEHSVRTSASQGIESPTTPLGPDSDSLTDLWQSGDYGRLSSQLQGQLSQAETTGDFQTWIEVANDLACTRRAAGDHESAAYFQLLAATAERQAVGGNSGRISATSIGNLACDAILAGRLAIAESLLWKSLLAELATGNDPGAAADWANLGLLASLLGDFDAAKQRLWWALKLHRRLGDAFHLALDLWHLAQLFESERNWKSCRRLYERATHWFGVAKHSEFHQAAIHNAHLNAAREAVLAFDVRLN